MMNKKVLFGSIAVIFLITSYFIFFQQRKVLSGVVTGLYGQENYVLSQDEKLPLKVGDPIYLGQTVVTGKNSSVEIVCDRDDAKKRSTTINIFQNSHFTINKSFLSSEKEFNARLIIGWLKVNIDNLFQTDGFEIETPNAVIGVRGTKFYMQAARDIEKPVSTAHVIESTGSHKVTAKHLGYGQKDERIIPVGQSAVITDDKIILRPINFSLLPKVPVYHRTIPKKELEQEKGSTKKTNKEMEFIEIPPEPMGWKTPSDPAKRTACHELYDRLAEKKDDCSIFQAAELMQAMLSHKPPYYTLTQCRAWHEDVIQKGRITKSCDSLCGYTVNDCKKKLPGWVVPR